MSEPAGQAFQLEDRRAKILACERCPQWPGLPILAMSYQLVLAELLWACGLTEAPPATLGDERHR